MMQNRFNIDFIFNFNYDQQQSLIIGYITGKAKLAKPDGLDNLEILFDIKNNKIYINNEQNIEYNKIYQKKTIMREINNLLNNTKYVMDKLNKCINDKLVTKYLFKV